MPAIARNPYKPVHVRPSIYLVLQEEGFPKKGGIGPVGLPWRARLRFARKQACLIFKGLPMGKKEGFCDFKLAFACCKSWPIALT